MHISETFMFNWYINVVRLLLSKGFFSESNYRAQFLLPSLLSQLGGSRQFSRLKAFLLSLSYVYVGEFLAIMLGCFLSKSSKIVILTDSVMSLMRKNLNLGTVN